MYCDDQDEWDNTPARLAFEKEVKIEFRKNKLLAIPGISTDFVFFLVVWCVIADDLIASGEDNSYDILIKSLKRSFEEN